MPACFSFSWGFFPYLIYLAKFWFCKMGKSSHSPTSLPGPVIWSDCFPWPFLTGLNSFTYQIFTAFHNSAHNHGDHASSILQSSFNLIQSVVFSRPFVNFFPHLLHWKCGCQTIATVCTLWWQLLHFILIIYMYALLACDLLRAWTLSSSVYTRNSHSA